MEVLLASRPGLFIPREKVNTKEAGIHKSALIQPSDPFYYRIRCKLQAERST